MARGGRLLDRLDAVKLALLGDGGADAALLGLARAAAESREAVDDPRLCEVLDAIETRAAVELAKRAKASGGLTIGRASLWLRHVEHSFAPVIRPAPLRGGG